MIHGLEQETLQVDEVAGYVNRGNLAPAILQDFISSSDALEQQNTFGWIISIADDVVAKFNKPNFAGDASKYQPLLV